MPTNGAEFPKLWLKLLLASQSVWCQSIQRWAQRYRERSAAIIETTHPARVEQRAEAAHCRAKTAVRGCEAGSSFEAYA